MRKEMCRGRRRRIRATKCGQRPALQPTKIVGDGDGVLVAAVLAAADE